MKPLDQATQQFILDLIGKVSDMTLATLRPDGYPQATAVSYANDGLTLYVGIGIDSQKAHNIRHSDKVSLAITAPYTDWNAIQGLSMAGTAAIVAGEEETARASACMLRRFPQLKTLTQGTSALPWEGAIFMRIVPSVISVLDYTKGFGHTELYEVR